MAKFLYRALDRAGGAHQGELDAIGPDDVLIELERRGWTALKIAPPPSIDWRRLSAPLVRRSIRARDVLDLTQELAALLKAGLTIDRALAVTASLTEKPAVKALVDRLLEAVREGRSFADALQGEPEIPPYYPSMVRAGELGGALPEVMSRIGAFMNRARELTERVQSALIYPAILLGMIGFTLLLVLFVVLPRFERLFVEAGATLPLPTRMVLGLGHAVSDYGAWVGMIVAGLVLIAARQWQHERVRLAVHRRILHVRLVGPLIQRLDTARFLRTLATLIANGATLPAAIRVAKGTIGNLALVEATDQLLKRLREGESLADRMTQAKLYPRIAVQLARVGEETGRLEPMLGEAADILDREAQQTLERGLAVFVPAVTIMMGLLVAALIASVLVGILSLNDLAF